MLSEKLSDEKKEELVRVVSKYMAGADNQKHCLEVSTYHLEFLNRVLFNIRNRLNIEKISIRSCNINEYLVLSNTEEGYHVIGSKKSNSTFTKLNEKNLVDFMNRVRKILGVSYLSVDMGITKIKGKRNYRIKYLHILSKDSESFIKS